MKLLILANGTTQNWRTWDMKIALLRQWFNKNPGTNFDVTLRSSNFTQIPWTPYIPDGKIGEQGYLGIDRNWYDKNITSQAAGYDIVLFVLPMSQWQYTNKARGWRTDRDQGPVELQIGCDERQVVSDIGGVHYDDAFFQLARHEILHALFMITGQTDSTHKWWDQGKLEEALNEVKMPTNKPVDQDRVKEMLIALQALLASFGVTKTLTELEKITKPQTSRLKDWAEAIKTFEGWTPGSISQRNHNPGNLRYSPYQIGMNKGFSVFKDDEAGMNALLYQLRLAASGGSKVYKPTDTLLEFFSKYAPSSDGNHPQTYAKFVANKLGLTIDVKISTLL